MADSNSTVSMRIDAAQRVESVLATYDWFQHLESQQQRLVVNTSRLLRVSAKTILGRQGEHPQSWSGVLSGVLKASTCSADGSASSFVLASAGDWIEECDILNGTPRTYDITTLTPTRILAMSAATFRLLTHHSIAFTNFAMRQLVVRHARMVAHSHLDRVTHKEAIVAKVIAELTELTSKAVPCDLPQSRQLLLTQDDLAEMAGLSRQTVNEALNAIFRKGLIDKRYGRISVPDLQGLRSAYMLHTPHARSLVEAASR